MIAERSKDVQGSKTLWVTRYKDLIVIIILLILSLSMSLTFFSCYPYEWDSVNFALAIDHFNVAMHQPHPPGYPVYIFIGVIFSLIFEDNVIALNAVSITFGALSGVFTYLLAKTFFGRKIGFLSALLLLLTPVHILFSVVAMSDILSTCMIVASIYLLYIGMNNNRNLLLGSLISGITIGIRPQHFLILVLSFLTIIFWKKNKKISIYSVLLFGVGILIWLVPLLLLSGGPFEYYSLLSAQLGVDRPGISLAQAESFIQRMYDGWTPIGILYFSISIILLLILLYENKDKTLGKVLRNKPFILMAIWIFTAIISIMTFELLYTVRYLLPIFPPISIILSYCIISLGDRLRDKRVNLLYFSFIAISILIMTMLSLSIVKDIQSSPPCPVQAANYISEHYSPDDTVILAGASYRHFQYLLPMYTILYGKANYTRIAQTGKSIIISESPLAMDKPVETYQKYDTINYKHNRVELYVASVNDEPFADRGFYNLEFWDGVPTRWISDNATIVYIATSKSNKELRFDAISFAKPRTMRIYLNGELASELYIGVTFTKVVVPLDLEKGINTIVIDSVDGAQRPSDTPGLISRDTRNISFAVQNVTIG